MTVQDLIERNLLRRSPLSYLLWPAGALNGIYQTRRRKKLSAQAWQAPCKVISIGNITSGGSGKTPFSIWLAARLQASGLRIGVSHRGYKGRLEHSSGLVSDDSTSLCEVEDSGDEACLIASRLKGIPVVVGKDRKASIRLLLDRFADLDVVIMDDGFQHLAVARDLDIVCFDAQTGCGNGFVLPAGYLREPLKVLAAADIAIVTAKSTGPSDARLDHELSQRCPSVYGFELRPSGFFAPNGHQCAASELAGRRILLVSGIANPTSFERSVRSQGLNYLHHYSFADHYSFTDKSVIDRIARHADKGKTDWIICTEKDLQKLARHDAIRDRLLALRMDLFSPRADVLVALILGRIGAQRLA